MVGEEAHFDRFADSSRRDECEADAGRLNAGGAEQRERNIVRSRDEAEANALQQEVEKDEPGRDGKPARVTLSDGGRDIDPVNSEEKENQKSQADDRHTELNDPRSWHALSIAEKPPSFGVLRHLQSTIPGIGLLSPSAEAVSIIGADWLNGRVRNGIGCDPVARDTGNAGLKVRAAF